MISINGKENIETMGYLFNEHIQMKNDSGVIVSILKRDSCDGARKFKFHDVTLLCLTHERNCSRNNFTHIGCYCQQGDAFLAKHVCVPIADEQKLSL